MVLLDVKDTDPEKFKFICGREQDTLLKLIEIINRQKKTVWIRNVVVPELNDTPEDIKKLNEFIKKIKKVEKVELLGYHTMAISKYGKLGLVYRLKGVPPMDGDRLNKLREYIKLPSETINRVQIDSSFKVGSDR